MKKCLFLIVIGMCSLSLHAQQTTYLDLLRSDIRTEKEAILKEYMDLSIGEMEAFMPVYRDYERALKLLNDEELDLVKKYRNSHDYMTDDQAKYFARQAFRIDMERVKLQKKYFKKMSKALSPIQAGRFIQLENQIGLLIQVAMAAQVPLIE